MIGALDVETIVSVAPMLLLAGAAIGVLAGTFGVGGGAISVPVFFETFRMIGTADDVAMPLAVGTSLAIIVPTSILSAHGHYRRGTVDVPTLRAWALPTFAGVVIGSVVARSAEPAVFQLVFIVVACVVATKLLAGNPRWKIRDAMPGVIETSLYGTVVGALSALMGIGGGAISTMVLTLNGMAILNAVSTSAAVGVLIAVPGTIGYVLIGLGKPGLPPDALGYVSLLALVVTLPTVLVTTRLGVRLAHRIPGHVLSRAFGCFLLLVAARFAYALVFAPPA